MRTVKHQLKPLTQEQEKKVLELACAYQFEKNHFSDQLLNQSNNIFNIHDDLFTIQGKLVKNQYTSKYQLPARMWKMALKEAYDLHIRTYESQIALVKTEINHQIYQFQMDLKSFKKETKENNNSNNAGTNKEKHQKSPLDCFKYFLYFVTNYLFFNFQTFTQFENEFYSKKFNKAKIYQRIQPIIQTLFHKALARKDVLKNDLFSSEELANLTEFINNINECKIEHKLLHQLIQQYCNWCVTAIAKFRQFKPIQSQINPTIVLDGNCYRLYSKYDSDTKKNRWFLDIMSMESGKRIKGLELTGFHHAKAIMKHKKYANLTLSFDPIDMTYYAHFTFKAKYNSKSKTNKKSKDQNNSVVTVGGDFGLTESFTFSDGWVSGKQQGKVLNDIAEKTKNANALLQSSSKADFFGVEKNNPLGKRNHQRNCFNHNALFNNINAKYRKQQRRYNRRLENYKYLLSNEIINHFNSDNVYRQYATDESTFQLVFEDLDYVQLGRNKAQKSQINLIKGTLTVLEEKIKQMGLPIEIHYVNPAYTSQTCPHCYYVDRNNRDSKQGKFRCCHCGFTAIDDVTYQGLTKVIPKEHLPPEDDFVAACNIEQRLSVLPDSTKLHKDKIKEILMQKHAEIKGSCKMFHNIQCCSP